MTATSSQARMWILLAAALALSGCADGQVVRLARGGQVVQCGPYGGVSTGPFDTNLNVFSERKLQACLDAYEAQGYKPIDPVPVASATPESSP